MPTKHQLKRIQQKKKRLNLQKKRLDDSLSEKINKVWYIVKFEDADTFYISEANKKSHVATWTQHRSNAIQFPTQQSVHSFHRSFLSSRNDVQFIHAREDKS